MNIEFASLWLAALWPMPLLVSWLWPQAKPIAKHSLKVPVISRFSALTQSKHSAHSRHWFLTALLWLTWTLLIIAAMNPQIPGQPLLTETRNRDLMLAMDLSDSMRERDFRLEGKVVDRLTASKAVAVDFISNRGSDRIGLVLFGSEAHLHSPFTIDHKTLMNTLFEVEHGLAGPQTAIGDAIALSVKNVVDSDAKKRVLILMTDGTNTSGSITPLDAARLAANNGLKIYTVGIGSSHRANFFNHSSGVDERLLSQIAQLTGGQYFLARSTQELSRIYAILDEVEAVENRNQYFRPKWSVYHLPLALAIVTGTIYLLLLQRFYL